MLKEWSKLYLLKNLGNAPKIEHIGQEGVALAFDFSAIVSSTVPELIRQELGIEMSYEEFIQQYSYLEDILMNNRVYWFEDIEKELLNDLTRPVEDFMRIEDISERARWMKQTFKGTNNLEKLPDISQAVKEAGTMSVTSATSTVTKGEEIQQVKDLFKPIKQENIKLNLFPELKTDKQILDSLETVNLGNTTNKMYNLGNREIDKTPEPSKKLFSTDGTTNKGTSGSISASAEEGSLSHVEKLFGVSAEKKLAPTRGDSVKPITLDQVNPTPLDYLGDYTKIKDWEKFYTLMDRNQEYYDKNIEALETGEYFRFEGNNDDICAEYIGEYYTLDDVISPPIHENCMCYLVVVSREEYLANV